MSATKRTEITLDDLYQIETEKVYEIVEDTDNESVAEQWQGLRRSQLLYLPIKRFFDILFSLIALIMLSPLFLVIAIAVKLDSPGPVFYFQKELAGRKEQI